MSSPTQGAWVCPHGVDGRDHCEKCYGGDSLSASMHVTGFRPPDDTWVKMKAVWDACQAAKITAPAEVAQFFGFEEPDESGMEVSLDGCLREWRDDMREGYELDVTAIPAGVTVIRFYTSY